MNFQSNCEQLGLQIWLKYATDFGTTSANYMKIILSLNLMTASFNINSLSSRAAAQQIASITVLSGDLHL